MQRAADCFVGTHDFSAVRAVGTEVRSPVRTVHYFNITRTGDLIECRVCANGFLYNMVRLWWVPAFTPPRASLPPRT